MKTNIKQNIKAIILGLIIAVGAGYVSAWTGPTQAPTGGNVPAPINVGGGTAGNIYAQVKTGLLTLDHLITSDLVIATGTPAFGKVLMSNDSLGTVAWVSTSTLGMNGGNGNSNSTNGIGGMQVFNSSGTFTVPAGVTKVIVEAWGGQGGDTIDNMSGTYHGGIGGYGKAAFSVTSNSAVPVTVGVSGSNGVTAQSGSDGTDSTFGSPVLLRATGGTGAKYRSNSSYTNGVAGTSNASLNFGPTPSDGQGHVVVYW